MNPDRITDVVHWELDRGEKPLWFGCPEPRSYVRAVTRWGRVALGIPAVAVGAFILPAALPLAAPFVIAGIGMLGSPLWMYLKAVNTVYVVTDRRLIVIEHLIGRSVMSCYARDIENVERKQGRGGVGTLVFSRVETKVVRDDGYNHSMIEERGFFGIADISRVWRLIMDLKNRAAGC